MDALLALRVQLSSGQQTSAQLQRALGVSQPTMSRLLGRLGPDVIRRGVRRNARYLLSRTIEGVGTEVPLYQVDAKGEPARVGTLRAVSQRAFLLESTALPALIHDSDGLFPGLPFFLSDLRPAGFLGRQFARAHPRLGLPEDLGRWSDDDALRALVHSGEDLPGNFLLGDAFDRWARYRPVPIALAARSRAYPNRVEELLTDGQPGSSAGGDQPKFVVLVADGWRQVKFSPPMGTAAGRRWADLLTLEHLALETMRAHDHPAAQTTVLEAGGRRFLEARRFDREGARGRRGLVSLAAVEAEWFGRNDTWLQAAQALEDAGRLSSDDAASLRWQWLFGRMIGNSDMHFGNISFTWSEGSRLALSPGYDMLPMRWAPVREEMSQATLEPLAARPEWGPLFSTARDAAQSFWSTAAKLTELHPSLRKLARSNLAALGS